MVEKFARALGVSIPRVEIFAGKLMLAPENLPKPEVLLPKGEKSFRSRVSE